MEFTKLAQIMNGQNLGFFIFRIYQIYYFLYKVKIILLKLFKILFPKPLAVALALLEPIGFKLVYILLEGGKDSVVLLYYAVDLV